MYIRTETTKSKLRPNKYGVAPKAARTIDGIVFASKLEGERYAYLKLMERTGGVIGLRLQPEYVLQEAFQTKAGEKIRPIIYRADFEYRRADGTIVCEDTKGVATKDYLIKCKLFLFRYQHIEFHQIKRASQIGGLCGAEASVSGRPHGAIPKKRPKGSVAID